MQPVALSTYPPSCLQPAPRNPHTSNPHKSQGTPLRIVAPLLFGLTTIYQRKVWLSLLSCSLSVWVVVLQLFDLPGRCKRTHLHQPNQATLATNHIHAPGRLPAQRCHAHAVVNQGPNQGPGARYIESKRPHAARQVSASSLRVLFPLNTPN